MGFVTGSRLSLGLALCALPALFATEASATPGAYHVAFGAGTTHSVTALCQQPPFSVPVCQRDEYFEIDASSQSGGSGHAEYWCNASSPYGCRGSIFIATLDCVVIQDLPNGHELFASGGSARIYLRVEGTVATVLGFVGGDGPCGAVPPPPPDPEDPFKTPEGMGGIFTIQPAPESSLEADISVTKTDSPDPVMQGQPLSYTVTVRNEGPAPASGVTMSDNLPAEVAFVSATPSQGTCTESSGVVDCDIGILASGEAATVGIDVTPQDAGTISNGAAATADQTDPNNANNTDLESTDVQSLGYARPKSATPLNIRLVPAFEACGSANASHGAPLDIASCNPPIQVSQYVTVGTPDANGKAANFTGSVNLKVVGENPIDPDNGDQADVLITSQLSDVRNRADLSDYTGELQAELTLRITDRFNGLQERSSATVTDVPLAIPISCTETADPAIGASCSVSTSADTLVPGAAPEGKRSIWELNQIRVYDGGSDGDVDTADNTLFAVQGLFSP
jgi:uncharacterized repeat protein (TIGR01451 family)